MTIIKPISDLRNKTNEISDIVHSEKKPVFIVKNGEGDMVVMSIDTFDLLQKKIELFSNLSVSQAQQASGERVRALSRTMKDVRKRIRSAR